MKKTVQKTILHAMHLALAGSLIVSAKAESTVLLEDGLTPSPERAAGAALVGSSPKTGGGVWSDLTGGMNIVLSDGGVVVNKADPGISMGAGLELPAAPGIISVEADVKPLAVDWLGLGFVTADKAIFWNRVALMVYIRPSGTFGVTSIAGGGIKEIYQGKPDVYQFNPGDFNHVVLSCNTGDGTFSLTINGTSIVENSPIPGTLPALGLAAIVFNTPREAEVAQIKNFAVKSQGAD